MASLLDRSLLRRLPVAQPADDLRVRPFMAVREYCLDRLARDPDAERAARCADLNRQIAELSKRPVRRSELQRRYDVECTSR